MPFFEYLGPFDSTEVDEGPVTQGGTVEVVDDDRAETFRAVPDSWREVQKPKAKQATKKAAAKRATTKPRPGAEDTPTENTEES